MKHTSRKKMLLSSVAMLLVAMLALGSATFAWFTANPKANASGLSLKTTASKGLVVKTDSDSTWSHEAALFKDQSTAFNLTPASQVQASPANFFTIDADKSSEKKASDTATFTTAGVGTYQTTGAVYSEKVYFKYSAGTDTTATDGTVNLTGVTITKNASADMEGAIRVTVVNSSDEIIGTYALSNAAPDKTVPAGANSKKMSEVTLVDYTNLENTLTTGTKKEVTEEAGTVSVTEKTANSVTVYVWLDGQDTACYSDNVGEENAAEIISSIQLDFELASTT